MIENLIELQNYIVMPYLFLVWMTGWWLSKDEIVAPLPTKIRLMMLSVNKFYRVLILSLLVGAVYLWVSPATDKMALMITFMLSNTLYEAGAKWLIETIEGVMRRGR